jgi:hypothetical protein
MPLPDPIEKPLIEELESLIPGVAPTKHSILPQIKTKKTLLYQTPGESENSEQLNLRETASQPKTNSVSLMLMLLLLTKPPILRAYLLPTPALSQLIALSGIQQILKLTP